MDWVLFMIIIFFCFVVCVSWYVWWLMVVVLWINKVLYWFNFLGDNLLIMLVWNFSFLVVFINWWMVLLLFGGVGFFGLINIVMF